MHGNIKNRVHNYSDNSIEPEKIETKNILIDEKNLKDLVIHFTRYVNRKSMKCFSLYFYKLMGKIKEHERKKLLMADDYMVDKVLDKIKEIIGFVNIPI